jgi:hypothetical protein
MAFLHFMYLQVARLVGAYSIVNDMLLVSVGFVGSCRHKRLL